MQQTGTVPSPVHSSRKTPMEPQPGKSGECAGKPVSVGSTITRPLPRPHNRCPERLCPLCGGAFIAATQTLYKSGRIAAFIWPDRRPHAGCLAPASTESVPERRCQGGAPGLQIGKEISRPKKAPKQLAGNDGIGSYSGAGTPRPHLRHELCGFKFSVE